MNNMDTGALILITLAFVMIIFLGIMPLITYISVLLINFAFDLALAFSYLQYVALGALIFIARYVFFRPLYTKKEE